MRQLKTNYPLWALFTVGLIVLGWLIPLFGKHDTLYAWISRDLSEGLYLDTLLRSVFFVLVCGLPASALGWVLQALIVVKARRKMKDVDVAAVNPGARMSVGLLTGLWFTGLILLWPVLFYGLLRWERATTQKYLLAVRAQDVNQLAGLFKLHHFAPSTQRVINSWTTDFGGFPGRADYSNARTLEMPDADRVSELRLWLLSPVIPMIRHRLEVQIGNDGKVVGARYDTHGCYFTPNSAGGGTFTNPGLSFRFVIPIPPLFGLVILSWLLAITCQALGNKSELEARKPRRPEISGAFLPLRPSDTSVCGYSK